MGLVLHHHRHALHISAPELPAVLHVLDLWQIQHTGLHSGQANTLIHLVSTAFHQPHCQGLYHQKFTSFTVILALSVIASKVVCDRQVV